MSRRTRRNWLAATSAVAVLAGVACSMAARHAATGVPGWLRSPWNVWLVVIDLVLVLVLVELLAGGSGADDPAPALAPPAPPMPPPLVAMPSVLRGRTREQDRLRSLVADPTGRMVVVCGSCGMGKTALAATVAHAAVAARRPVFWLRRGDAGEAGKLADQMVRVATALGCPPGPLGSATGAGVADLVWRHLDRTPGWVVVVDGLDAPQAVLPGGAPPAEDRGWLRPSEAGLLLVTSRVSSERTWGPKALRIELEPLADDAGAALLLDTAPAGGGAPEARALAARLGGLPMALLAAGRVVAEPASAFRTFAGCLVALEGGTTAVVSRPDTTDAEVARRVVIETTELALDQLHAEGVHLARPVLRLLALFAEAPVARSLITADLAASVGAVRDVTAASIDAAVVGLSRYGLVDIPDSAGTFGVPTIVLHPLVRETNIAYPGQEGPDSTWRDAVARRVIEVATESVNSGRVSWGTARLLAPHLLALPCLQREEPHGFQPARDGLRGVAELLYASGEYDIAVALRERVLLADHEALGPDHPDTLTSRSELANTLYALGDDRRAAELHQQVLTDRERLLGPDHPDTLRSRNNVALAWHVLGDHRRAAELHQHVLTDQVSVLGPDHPDTLKSRNNLAAAWHVLGDHRRAAELHQHVLTDRERLLGPDHPDTLDSRGNLALALQAMGHHRRATELHRLVLADRERVLGPDHPDTVRSRHNLANSLSDGPVPRSRRLGARVLLRRRRRSRPAA